MDYLNRSKTLRHQIILMVGYVLVAVAIVISTLVLVYQAYGFGLTKNGIVIQNGLAYFSSQPHPANIYINGRLNSAKTNTRLALPANVYQIKLSRTGYRDWQRTINLAGGSVQHFDYPLLFPRSLVTKKLQTFSAAPGLMTQSPDQRWLLIGQPDSLTDFALYDLKNPTKPPTTLSLPATLLTKATGSESWQLGDWADDNQHVLLQHNYDAKTEFVLLDRNDATQSVNLNTTLAANPTKLTLNNKKFDQYYLYDAAAGSLQTASLKAPAAAARLDHVLAYKSYGNDTVLYATADGAPSGRVLVKLISGTKTTSLRSLAASDTYLVDLTQYAGTTYIVVGASSTNRVYIYRDPVAQLNAQPQHAIVPIQVLHVDQANYLSFSNNAQFIVAENGMHFGVYDLQNKLGYNYTATAPLDAPQPHANWMDGDRLVYTSHDSLSVADYDNNNRQSLMPTDSHYLPAFAPDSKFVYSLAPSATAGQSELTQTALLAN